MAIFASTTSTGYSDPIKALSIKALEQRLKDQQAQSAAQQPDAAMMATIPGGIGHVLGVVGDKMAQGRNEAAIAAQRDVLSKAIAGYDPNSGPPPAAVATTDPDLYKSLLSTWAENRRAAATDTTTQRGQDLSLQGIQGTNQTSRDTTKMTTDTSAANTAATIGGEGARLQTKIEADKAAAAEAARVARENAIDAEQRLGNRPASEGGKITQDVQSGKLTPEQGEAQIKKLGQPGVPEQKLLIELQGKSIDAQSSLGTLDEALDLINHPKGIHAGNYAGGTQTIGEHVPGFLQGSSMLPDPETTKNTQRYNQIMGAEALSLLTQMKGASSDKDVQINFKIANDPNASLDAKKAAIQVLKTKLAAHLATYNAGLAEAGGTVPKLGGAPAAAAKPAAAAATADPLEGKIADGPDGPIIRRNGKWEKHGG